jgi:hypothetical protein
MTPQQIVGLFVRILAVWLVVSAFQLIGVGMALDKQPTEQQTLVPYGISAVLFISAFVLWLFPMVVSHKLIPRTQFDNRLTGESARDIAVVACVTLGLWVFAARALPLLTQYVSVAALLLKNNQSLSIMGEAYSARLIEGLAELVVAALLTFKARKIATYFLRQ